MKNNKKTVIDLFSGCGGMSLGFEMAEFNPILAIDIWKDALETYKYNNKGVDTVCADISDLNPEKIKLKYNISDVDVIIGGPPCQGFSIAGKRILEDKRNELYKSFVNFVQYFQPKAFVLENVPNVLSMGGGAVRDAIVRDFELLGYNVVYKVLLASDYGVPQNRRRAIFVGLKNDKFSFPQPTLLTPICSKDALSDLPEATIADGEAYPTPASSNYQKDMRKNSLVLFNHQITVHNDKTIDIISLVPDGGNYKNLPLELRETRKVNIAWTRLNSSKPSFTIDTGHRHHFHYEYNRVPTARESARLQSFPDNFVFKCSKTSQCKQIGNAVPPLMAKAIAVNLLKQLKDV